MVRLKRIKKQFQTLTESSFYRIIFGLLFVILSGWFWLLVNGFDVARPNGFDPLRYEFDARTGIDYVRSNEQETIIDESGHKIVVVLKIIYTYLPYFYGYILVMAGIVAVVSAICRNKATLFSFLNPIAFFYIGQTGKDGITIISNAVFLIMLTQLNSRVSKLVFLMIFALCSYVRAGVIVFYPLIFLQLKGKSRIAVSASIISGLIFKIYFRDEDSFESFLGFFEATGDDSAIDLGRSISYGTGSEKIIIRIIFYSISILFQPFAGILKFYQSFEYYILLEAVLNLAMLIIIVRFKILRDFLIGAVPFAILIGFLSPFYHYRYLAVFYPVILATVMVRRGSDLKKKVPRYFQWAGRA